MNKFSTPFLLSLLIFVSFSVSGKSTKLKCIPMGQTESIKLKELCVGDKVLNESTGELVTISEFFQKPHKNSDLIQTTFKVKSAKGKLLTLFAPQVVVVDSQNCIKSEKENHCPGTKFYSSISSNTNTLIGFKFAESYEPYITPVVKKEDGIIDNSSEKEILDSIKFSKTGFVGSQGECYGGLIKIDALLKKCAKKALIDFANSRCKDYLKDNFKPIEDVPSIALTYICKGDEKDKNIYGCEAKADVKCEALDAFKLSSLLKQFNPTELETRLIRMSTEDLRIDYTKRAPKLDLRDLQNKLDSRSPKDQKRNLDR